MDEIWSSHGEVDNSPSPYVLREEWLRAKTMGQASSSAPSENMDTTFEILEDAFPFRHNHMEDNVEEGMNTLDDEACRLAYEKYNALVSEAQTPLYADCDKTVLGTILKLMIAKVESRTSDKGLNKFLSLTKEVLPSDNKYPSSYKAMKKVLKNLGLGYDTIHACKYGCILYYKEHADLLVCPVCKDPRYDPKGGKRNIPNKTVKYFPLTPRLQRLYMSPDTAKEMRWHAERNDSDSEYIRHPSDGEAWKSFDNEFPEFSVDCRNVRLALATDGFNPFGSSGVMHSTWPVVLIPYNLPPHLCMKKDFNILSLLISGPKSPGKCLNVFMRPLIDELKHLWEVGAPTYDRHSGSSFNMRAAVMSTISDFPGLGMLGGIQVKGYKACPVCLDNVDAIHLTGRMSYQGHRRWLPKEHPWRYSANAFNGKVELRDPPPTQTGFEILSQILSCDFEQETLHPSYGGRARAEKICWTHETIFYELPYWMTFVQPYSLDVMHIEKNVFDNIIGTILCIEGKTKDDQKAREGLKKLKIRRHLWMRKSKSKPNKLIMPKAAYTVFPDQKVEILEHLKNAKYPDGYAGSLRTKMKPEDKKYIGLKTHDCHVILQRLLPVFIRHYLPSNVVNPLVSLSHWFRRLCCRELRVEDCKQLKLDIIRILCQLERIFPPSFFTIMVHLMVHLPDQILMKGPVHYNWMYPMERLTTTNLKILFTLLV